MLNLETISVIHLLNSSSLEWYRTPKNRQFGSNFTRRVRRCVSTGRVSPSSVRSRFDLQPNAGIAAERQGHSDVRLWLSHAYLRRIAHSSLRQHDTVARPPTPGPSRPWDRTVTVNHNTVNNIIIYSFYILYFISILYLYLYTLKF